MIAKLVYGPFDVAPLTGETVALSIKSDMAHTGWTALEEKNTDSSGKVQFSINGKKIPQKYFSDLKNYILRFVAETRCLPIENYGTRR